MPEPTVLVENRGPVRIITINRPERRNAIDLPTAQLLERVVDAFEADPTARVAVLTGAGGTFCAGMDLKAAATGAFALTEKRGPLGIAGMPIKKPVIAAVEGHALAGGCELALVADLIVASTDSEFGIPEPKRAWSPRPAECSGSRSGCHGTSRWSSPSRATRCRRRGWPSSAWSTGSPTPARFST